MMMRRPLRLPLPFSRSSCSSSSSPSSSSSIKSLHPHSHSHFISNSTPPVIRSRCHSKGRTSFPFPKIALSPISTLSSSISPITSQGITSQSLSSAFLHGEHCLGRRHAQRQRHRHGQRLRQQQRQQQRQRQRQRQWISTINSPNAKENPNKESNASRDQKKEKEQEREPEHADKDGGSSTSSSRGKRTLNRQLSLSPIMRMMRAVEVTQPGGPHTLKVQPILTPKVEKSTDVLIQVHAAGVNRPDCLQRAGLYKPPPGTTNVLGLEVAGVIVEAGSQSGWEVGDSVCALVQGGGYAEYCIANGGCCLPIPFNATASPDLHSTMSEDQKYIYAAAIPEAFFTVYKNLFSKLKGSNSINVEAGETLLVHGGSSGIGMACIMLCKAYGVKVLATAGTEEKKRACIAAGAMDCFNYNEGWVDGVRRAAPEGVNAVLDMVGGDYLQQNIDVLSYNGRLCIIGFLRGATSTVNFSKVLFKSLHVTGSVLRASPEEFKVKLTKEVQENVWPLFESGKIKPLVDTVYADLSSAPASHTHMENSAHIGKIVLQIAKR